MSEERNRKKVKVIETSTRKEESNLSQINLPDDCLIHIFKFLLVADKIKVERVCTLWKDLARRSWSDLNELIVEPRHLGLRTLGIQHQYQPINDYVLREILKRCGKYLEKIDFTLINIDCKLNLVARYCPTIQSIKSKRVSLPGIRSISKCCQSISELILNADLSKKFKEEFENLFSNSTKFRVLEFTDDVVLSKMSLSEIVVIKTSDINNELHIIIGKVKTLNILRVEFASESVMNALTKTCTNLTELHLSFRSKINKIDKKLSQVFAKHKYLKSIGISGFIKFTGKCFLSFYFLQFSFKLLNIIISFDCLPCHFTNF